MAQSSIPPNSRTCTCTQWTSSPYILLLVPALMIFSFVSSVLEESNLTKNSETEISTAISSDDPSSSSSLPFSSSTTTKYDSNPNAISAQLLTNCKTSPLADGPRWSEKEFPTSTAKSHFNCFLNETLCTYYYPADFFDPECGIGKDYIKFTEEAEAMRKNKTLWNFMPSVGFPTLTLQNTCLKYDKPGKPATVFSPEKNTHQSSLSKATLKDIGFYTIEDEEHGSATCMTERLTMLHVHKAGGSSLHEAFNNINRQGRTFSTLVRHKFFTPSQRPTRTVDPSHHRPSRQRHFEDSMYNFSHEALTHATKYPQEIFEPEQHVIFAVVRNPVDRFISSIGQALGARGSTGNQIGKKLRGICVEGASTSAEALKCIAKYVQKHGFWIELHFTPQVIDISFTTLFTDVPIGIFSFRNLTTVLDYFGVGGVKLRDGKADQYRSDPLLTNMTVADYDEETLKIVCEIYEMDVIMQRSLGMEVEKCDPFIPKSQAHST